MSRRNGNGSESPRTNGRAAHRSISFNLAALVALQLVVLAGLMTFTTVNDFRRARTVAGQQAQDDALRTAGSIEKALTTAKIILASQASLQGYDNVFNDPPSCTVTSKGADVFTRGSFQIIRGDGSVACTSLRASGGVDGPGYAGSSWLPRINRGAPAFIAGPVNDPVTKQRAVLVVAPMTEIRGALVLSLDLAGLATGLEKQGSAAARAVLVTTEGRDAEVTRSPGRRVLQSVHGTRLAAPLQTGTTTMGLDGVQRIFAEADVAGLRWHVAVGIPTSAAFAQARLELRDRILLGGLIVAMVLFALFVVQRRIARPVRALVGAIEDTAWGSRNGRVPESGPKELAKLGRRFNRMLREREETEIGLVEMFNADRRVGGRRELDRMKSAFLMAISHELRTPLTAVSGYASLLEEDADSLSREEVAEYAHDIGVAAGRLERLLLDILDMERLARGMLEPHRQQTDIRALVERVLEFNDLSETVLISIPAGTVANADAGFVERILENLVRNAVKHTPRGTPIWVRGIHRKDGFMLVVDDAGPGVPDELKLEIFEPFRQGDLAEGPDLPLHAPGTGIGLALVNQFARLHGGRAWVEDRPGGGASFRVLLSVRSDKKPSAPAGAGSHEPLRIR